MLSPGSIHIPVPAKAAVAAVFAVCLTVGTASAAAASPSPSPSAPTGPLTTAQLMKALPTGTDVSGFTYTASEDTSTLTSKQTPVTTGGPACQKLVDAGDGLSTTYGTVAEVDRTLHETAGNRTIYVKILSFQNADKAKAVLTDTRDALNSCTNLADGTTTLAVAPIPQLADLPDRVGFGGIATTAGISLVAGEETVQNGSTIVEVLATAPLTQDSATLQALGAVLGTAANATISKVNSASST